jgi:hypothetical protein
MNCNKLKSLPEMDGQNVQEVGIYIGVKLEVCATLRNKLCCVVVRVDIKYVLLKRQFALSLEPVSLLKGNRERIINP